jgi:hypothetical protein
MKIFNVPGVAWAALLTFLTQWLSQYFGDVVWVPTAIAVLMGVIKFIQMLTEKAPPPPPPGAMGEAMPVQKQPNAVARWLVG